MNGHEAFDAQGQLYTIPPTWGQITLTEGKPKVVAVSTVAGGDETEMLRFAATFENGSEQPLAGAIVNGAAEKWL